MSGVISSTLLTLVLIPTAYTYVDSFEAFIRRAILHMQPRFAERLMPDNESAPGETHPAYVPSSAGK